MALQSPTADESRYRAYTRDYLYRRQYDDTPLPRLVHISHPLWSIIRRALDHDPKKRQFNAQELARDIERFLAYGVGVPSDLDVDETTLADPSGFVLNGGLLPASLLHHARAPEASHYEAYDEPDDPDYDDEDEESTLIQHARAAWDSPWGKAAAVLLAAVLVLSILL